MTLLSQRDLVNKPFSFKFYLFFKCLLPECCRAVGVLGVPWSVAPKGLSGSGEGSIGAEDGLDVPGPSASGHQPQGGYLRNMCLWGCLDR